jgi:acyl-CoA thioesterase I
MMSNMMRWMFRAVIGVASLVFALILLIVIEALVAFRVARIDGFAPERLNGQIGSGPFIDAVWIGDSTSAGVGASSPDLTVPRRVAVATQRGVNLTVLSVSGATIQDAVEEQLPALTELDPDVVFIGIGNNDVTHLSSKDTVRRGMREILDQVSAVEPREIVVLGIAEFGGTPLLAQPLRWLAGVRTHQLDEVVRSVAAEYGATYVPIADLTAEGFAADPEGTHAEDRFHPSDAGYALWVEAIVQTMEAEGVMARLRSY